MKAKSTLSPMRDTTHRSAWLVVALCACLSASQTQASSYYVNNTSTNSDIFCTAIGSDSNDGLTPDTPMASLSALLARYTLGPSDTVRVDVGTYVITNNIVVESRHGGDWDQHVVLQGAGRNTIIQRVNIAATNACCILVEASFLDISGFVFTGARVGVYVNAEASTRAHITDNVFKGNSKAGIEVFSSGTSSYGWFYIARNLFYDTGDCMLLEPDRTDACGDAFEVYNNTASVTNYCVLRMGGMLYSSSVRNNIFVASGGSCYAAVSDGWSLFSSYNNNLWTTNGGVVAKITINSNVITSAKLADWQRFTASQYSGARDQSSFSRLPAFAFTASGDYHLKSFGGRWVPTSGTNGYWTVDGDAHSPCIDAGDPYAYSERVAFECSPNGERLNLGCYGGTSEASKSAPSRRLLAMAPDCGQDIAQPQPIYWNATGQGWASGNTVQIKYSPNGGATWLNIDNVSQPSASTGSYDWYRPAESYTTNGCWIQVNAASDPYITDKVYLPPLAGNTIYYVNDASTNDDAFCTAVGLDTNDGLTPGTPMASLTALLARYTLGYTNTVCVDAGTYSLTSNIVVESRHGGNGNHHAVIMGAGGSKTLLMRQASNETNACCMFSEASYLDISGFVFTGARVGLCVNAGVSMRTDISDNVFKNNTKAGLEVFSNGSSTYGTFSIARNLFYDTGDCMRLEADNTQATGDTFDVCNNTAIATNGCYGLTMSGMLYESSVRNNIFVANGGTCYRVTEGGNLFYPDRNDLWTTNGGIVARLVINSNDVYLATLADWQRFTVSLYCYTSDQFSLCLDPAFASPTNGDYHLKSFGGRWLSASGTNVQWTVDGDAHSPCIDAGDTGSDRIALEPAPNGGRLNLGCYGGSAEASKSAPGRLLLAMAPDSGQDINTAQTIYWNPAGQGWTSNDTVRIDYSTDGGTTWLPVSNATALAATVGDFSWNRPPDSYGSAYGCWVRVSASEDGSVVGKALLPTLNSLAPPITPAFYVNDSSTVGDVWCTAVGSDTNDGLTPSTPMASLSALLARYTLSSTNTVYVDAGTYVLVSNIVVDSRHSGSAEQHAVIQGAGLKTILSRQNGNATNACCILVQAPYVQISGFVFTGARVGVCVDAAASGQAFITENTFTNNTQAGIEILSDDSSTWGYFQIARNLFYNTGDGMRLEADMTNGFGDRFEVCNNTAIVTNGAALKIGGALDYSYVRNNIFVAQGGGACLVATYTGAPLFSSSYNDLWATNGGAVARITINGAAVTAFKLQDWEYLRMLLRNNVGDYSIDMFNLSRDPAFASPATGDYHLKSFGGRWNTGPASNGQWTVDQDAHSPCIDAGYAYDSERLALEPAPNGGRMNLGCYGGTAEASMSAPGRMLFAMAPNQTLGRGAYQYIYWNATGCGWQEGDTVCIQYSTDGGTAWQSVSNAEQLSASSGTFNWDRAVDSYGSSGCWIRVSATTNAEVTDTAYLPPPPERTRYYVNDASTIGDVFCTAVGNDNNDGLTPGTPMATLSALLARYMLCYTNQVCVDSGTYTLSSNIVVETRHWGLANQHLLITGAGDSRTLLQRQAGAATNTCCMRCEASYVDVSGFVFTGAHVGLSVNAGISRLTDITDNQFRGNKSAGVEIFNRSTNAFGSFEIVRNLFVDTGDCMRLDADRTDECGDLFEIYNNTAVVTNGYSILSVSSTAGSSTVRNNIFVANGGTCYATAINNYLSLWPNGNDLWTTNGGTIAKIQTSGSTLILSSLADWQRFANSQYYSSGCDARSFSRDPAFASPANGDYHLKSLVGRWVPGTGTNGQWVVDQDAHSPCIDAGEPYFSTDRIPFEPAPNGDRLNLGCYGGTAEASKSAPERMLLALAPDCGQSIEQYQLVYWNATGGGWGNDDTVDIKYSTDGGVVWQLANTVAASQGYYYWSQPSVSYGSISGCWIRVSSTQGTAVSDQTILSSPTMFFVNDAVTDGDIWCTDVGNDSNDGLSSRTPMASVQTVINYYKPTRGATIYVDAGTYPLSADLVLPDTGPGGETPAHWLSLIGAGRSTVFDRQSTAANTCCLRVKQDFAHIEGVTCRGAETGIIIDPSTCRNANVRAVTATACKGFGLSVLNDSSNVVVSTYSVSNSIFFSNGGGLNLQTGNGYRRAKFTVQNNTIVNDSGVGIAVGGQPMGTVLLNNIVTTKGSGYCLVLVTDSALSRSDYNDLYAYGGASVARWLSGFTWRTAYGLSDWQRARALDSSSFGRDPLFVSSPAGDFHLRSASGTRSGTGWVTYTTTSPCIDAGDPLANFSNEPSPNGHRINMGAYGGTAEASKSVLIRSLSLLSPAGGETWSGSLPIIWSATGNAWNSNDTVRIEYSFGGASWTAIANATSQPPTGSFVWTLPNLTTTSLSVYIRVVCNQDSSVYAVTKSASTIKRTITTYYVNDSSTNSDEFCTAAGSDTNTGTSSNAPVATLTKILTSHTLGPGDTVYVDAGNYDLIANTVIASSHAGAFDAPIRIVGVHGRTVLNRGAISTDFYCLEVHADYVRIENITCKSALIGIFVNASTARHVQLVGNICCYNASNGIMIRPLGTTAGEEYQLLQNVVHNNGAGIYLQGASYMYECRTVFVVENNSIFNGGPGITILNSNSGGYRTNLLKNNLVHATNTSASCVVALKGALHYSDFNDLFPMSSSGYVGSMQIDTMGGMTNCATLTQWRTLTGQDANSVSTNGLFVNVGGGNLRLRPNSPCVDAGINSYWMFDGKDPDGNARISGKACDIGAYELNVISSVRVFLQGPFIPGTEFMSQTLSQAQAIPLQSPYADDPRTVSSIPSNTTDWVLMQFRQTTNGPAVLSRSVFLRQDGWLLSDKGSTDLDLDLPRNQSFYLSVKHRNHLAALSSVPLSITNETLIYDFTASDSAYLGGSNACATVSSATALFRALRAGDADGDGLVSSADFAIALSQTNGVGYRRGDANLDGEVTASDLELISNNLNAASAIIRPDTPLTSILRVSPALQTLSTEEMSILEAVDPSTASDSSTFSMGGTTSALSFNWTYVRNASGAQPLDSDGGEPEALYVAGTVTGVTDIVEAWTTNDALGRATINVIASETAEEVGKALIIAGRKSSDDTLWPATDYLAENAHDTLRYRGFTEDNIVYLSSGTGEGIDYDSTSANATAAFTSEVAGANNLFVYLVDHGGNSSGDGYFRLNASETITAAQLDTWLDDLQNTYNTPVTVLLDFCYAGSFLHDMTYGGPAPRIVVAACGTNQPSYFVAGGLVSFSSAFFSGVLLGYDVNQCFSLAQGAMSTYQGALLDDDGDGTYTTNDWAVATGIHIGPTSVASGDVPTIGAACGNQVLTSETTANLWIGSVSSLHPIAQAWCQLVPPGYDPDPDDPVTSLPSLALAYDDASGRYAVTYDGFTTPGTYSVQFYVQDSEGNVSAPRQAFVSQVGFDDRAILVAGGDTNGAAWPAVEYLTELAYATLRLRLLPADHIHVLSPNAFQDLDFDGSNDVSALSTAANLEQAVSQWATTNATDRLTLYIIGADSVLNAFRINASECLSTNALAAWIHAFQVTNLVPVTVILDFPYSGAFVPSLADPDLATSNPDATRIVMASATADGEALFSNGGTVSFSQYLLSEVIAGETLGDAFTAARRAIRRVSGSVRQRAQLDDTLNGVGNEKNVDGDLAEETYVGSAFVTGADNPVIGLVTAPTALPSPGTPVTLWASDVAGMYAISNVWCTITPPDYAGEGSLPTTNLVWQAANNRYEVTCADFVLPGSYTLTFYAQDSVGAISDPVQSEIILADAYEIDDDISQASLYDGRPQIHTFHTATDSDWVRLYLVSDFIYDFETYHHSETLDTVLDLYHQQPDGSLELLDHVDEEGSDLGEYTGLDYPTNGWYWVQITPYEASTNALIGTYEFSASIPAAAGMTTLIVLGLDDVVSGALPSNSFASITGQTNKYFSGSTSVVFSGLTNGTYLVSVPTPNNYFPREDPDLPYQVQSLTNTYYANPRRITASGGWFLTGFELLPNVCVTSGLVRDAWTQAFIPNAQISFTASSGSLTGQVVTGGVILTSYCTNWLSAADGRTPSNIVLAACNWNLSVARSGYQTGQRAGAVSNMVAGTQIALGTTYLVPLDTNSNAIADSWETLYFPGGGMSPTADSDGDGLDNQSEYLCGTDPTNALSVLRFTDGSVSAGVVSMTWSVTGGRSYQVLSVTSLVDLASVSTNGPWEAASGQATMEWSDTEAPLHQMRFYRVRLNTP